MSIEFLSPWALWLSFSIPLLWIVRKLTKGTLLNKHWIWVASVRSLCIFFVVLGLSQPVLKLATQEPAVVFLVDASNSISDTFISNGLAWINRLTEGDRRKNQEIIFFADRPISISSFEDETSVLSDLFTSSVPAFDRNSTDLERAVKSAISRFDRNRAKRLVILTDGNETVGNVLRNIEALKKENIKVHFMVPKVSQSNDAWVVSIDSPPRVRSEEIFLLTVRVYSPRAEVADLEIMADGIPLERKKIDFVQGVNNVDFEVTFSTENMIKLTAQLYYPNDLLEENNRLESTLWIDQKPKLLLVSGKENDHRNFIDILVERGFAINHMVGGDLPRNVNSFANYDLVFLSNVAKRNLSDDSMNALMGYVRDLGGGVVFAAGERVFGDNGYSGTPIEDFLPAEFKARERKKDLALVIAIDRSYSMKGRKIEYAKEASRAALELLEEQHKFAVVAFDSQPYISVPMRMVRSKRRAEDRISRIKASGQTNIYPALGVVYRLLDRESSVAKHVILLSDGDTHPADFEKLLRRIRDAGIIVSTVTIGKTGDPKLMEKIANWGGGQNYVALSAEAIPQIFIEETQKALKSSEAGEKISTQLAMNVRAFTGIKFNNVPDLSGLISTKLRDTADTLLKTGDGEPLLSRWQYGLGKTVLFSSTVSGKWAENWLDWADYGKFWDQVIRQTMKNPDIRSKRLVLSSRDETTVAKVVLLNEKGEFRDNLSPVLIVKKEDGTEAEKLSLKQVGPGYYEVGINKGMSRPAFLSLSPEGGVGLSAARSAGVIALNPTFSEELRTLPPNLPLLREIARLSGGKLSPDKSDIFSPDDQFGSLAVPLLPWMIGFALLLFFMDIYMRRSPFIWKALSRKT